MRSAAKRFANHFFADPKTGEKSLQVHGQGAFKLYLKDSHDGEERIVDNLEEVRAFMHKSVLPRCSFLPCNLLTDV